MRVTVTFGELMDKYDWENVCNVLGLNVWCINEGLASRDEEITISEEDAKKIGILSEGVLE